MELYQQNVTDTFRVFKIVTEYSYHTRPLKLMIQTQ